MTAAPAATSTPGTPGPGSVVVWCARLDPPAAEVSRLARLLDDDERRRADRFIVPEARRRYVVAHASLRLVLARALSCDAREVRFGRASCRGCGRPHGKPHLMPPSALRFNLSHAGDLALVAVAEREVGVDVELVRAGFPVEPMARHHFTRRERLHVAGMPAGQRDRAFFGVWARKEAVLKAAGDGLTRPLTDVPVPVSGDGDVTLGPVTWRVVSLAFGERCVGAVAAQGGDWWAQTVRVPA